VVQKINLANQLSGTKLYYRLTNLRIITSANFKQTLHYILQYYIIILTIKNTRCKTTKTVDTATAHPLGYRVSSVDCLNSFEERPLY